MTTDRSRSGPEGDKAYIPSSTAPTEEVDNGSAPLLIGFIVFLIAIGAFRSWWIPGIMAGLLLTLFMHELGHFVAARASGMKVTQFFLGFGPKIWSFQRGETEYGFKAIPAGAYVRILGLTNLEEVEPEEEHRSYRAQPWWQRMVTICAGSAMHFAMAIASLIVLFGAYSYTGVHGPPWEVERVVEGSSAEALGLESGDRITSFAGDSFDNWREFGELVGATPVGPVELEVERGEQMLVLTGDLGARSGDVVGAGFGIWMSEDRASQGWTVTAARPESNGVEFGLSVDDVILRSAGVARPSQLDFAQILQEREGERLSVVVLRDGREQELNAVVNLDRTEPFRGFLGVEGTEIDVSEPTWFGAIGLAVEDFWSVTTSTVGGLVDLVNPLSWGGGQDTASQPTNAPPATPASDSGSGDRSRPVSIIGIARLFADSESVSQVLYLFMLVNVFVGVFNLVPLLPFDGGHAALATWERAVQLLGRRPNYRVDVAALVPLTWIVIGLLVGVGLWSAALDIFAWPV